MSAQLFLQLDAAQAFANLAFATMNAGQPPRDPSLSALALLAEWAGVAGVGISAHSEKMIQFGEEVTRLKNELTIPIHVQLSPEMDLVRLAFELQPARVTLVPPRWIGPSIIGGLDPHQLSEQLKQQIMQLHEADVEVAVRVEPALDLIKKLQRYDIDVLVFSAQTLMSSGRGIARRERFKQLTDASLLASRLGFKVAVTGGLDLIAVEQVSRISQISEIHVGHALLSRAMLRGVERAAQDFMNAMERGQQSSL